MLGSLHTADGGLVMGVMVYVYLQSKPSESLHRVSRWIGWGSEVVGKGLEGTGFRPPKLIE